MGSAFTSSASPNLLHSKRYGAACNFTAALLITCLYNFHNHIRGNGNHECNQITLPCDYWPASSPYSSDTHSSSSNSCVCKIHVSQNILVCAAAAAAAAAAAQHHHHHHHNLTVKRQCTRKKKKEMTASSLTMKKMKQ